MPKYQCPDCEAVLRRAEAITPGKKIKCPKCQSVFAAKPLEDDEEEATAAKATATKGGPPKPPPPPPKSSKPAADEDEEGGTYGVFKEKADEEEKEEMYFGSLRDRFAKSKVGPAMYITVVPSNWLLRLGLLTGVIAVAYFGFAVFPIVFCEATPSRPFIRPRVDMMLHATLMFIFSAVMCLGASAMHNLTSYTWAIIGAIMSLVIYIPTGIMLAMVVLVVLGPAGMLLAALAVGMALIGIWCIVILMNPKVKEGFKERAEQLM
jgi:phage FluMu protein Com